MMKILLNLIMRVIIYLMIKNILNNKVMKKSKVLLKEEEEKEEEEMDFDFDDNNLI